MVSPEKIWRAGLGVSGRSISFLTSPQRLQVARADTLLPREKRAFFLQRVVFHLRPHGAVAPSDADVEAAIAAAQRALQLRTAKLLADNPRAHMTWLRLSLVFGWSSMFGSLAFASAGTKQGNSYAARRSKPLRWWGIGLAFGGSDVSAASA